MPFNSKNPVSKWWVFALLYAAWCLSFLDRSAMNMAAPVIVGDLHISPARQGMVLGIFYLGYSFMQIPGGWMSDRYGPKWIVIVALVVWSVFTMMTGLTWSFLSLIGVRILFGLGEGIFPGASVKSIYQYFVPKERGSTTAFLMSSNFVGSMIAPFIIIPLIYYMGWRALFVVMSGVGMLLAAVYALSVPARVKSSDTAVGVPVNWHTITTLFRLRETWRLVGIFFCISLVNKGLDTWMPSYLLRECGISLKSAGFLLSAPYLSAGIATALGGWVLMRYFRDRERMFMNVNIMLLCLALAGMYCASTVNEVILCEVLVYFFKSFVFSTIMFLPSRTMPPVFIGLGISIVNFGGQTAGFVSAPLIGAILELTKSYSIVFLCLVGAAVGAMVINMAYGRIALYPARGEDRQPHGSNTFPIT